MKPIRRLKSRMVTPKEVRALAKRGKPLFRKTKGVRVSATSRHR